MESTAGECVKLKTVTEIRQSNERNTFTAESVYLVLNSLRDREPEEKLKQRCDIVRFTFFFQDDTSSTVLNATKAMDR